MGYRRSVPTFTFMGTDRLGRSVDLVVDSEERSVQSSPRRPRRPKSDGSLSVGVSAFGADLEDGRIELVIVGSPSWSVSR